MSKGCPCEYPDKAGFQPVGEFCWGKGQEPASLLHFIHFRPTADRKCEA